MPLERRSTPPPTQEKICYCVNTNIQKASTFRAICAGQLLKGSQGFERILDPRVLKGSQGFKGIQVDWKEHMILGDTSS